MNILLAGGAGFIGTWAARLVQGGPHRVTVVDDLSGAAQHNVDWLEANGIILHQMSIREYVEKYTMEGYDAVVNLACRKMVACTDPADAFDVNTVQAGLLARAAVEAGVPRYVHISTGSVYGPKMQYRYVQEADAPEPQGLYAASKLAGEHVVLDAISVDKVNTFLTTLRLFNVMGSGQAYGPTGGVLARWCAAVADLDTPPELHGHPWTKRMITDVVDVARAILWMVEDKDQWDTPILNIGSCVQVELQQLWDEVRKQSGTDLRLSQCGVRDGVFRVQCCNQLSRDLGMIYNENWQELVRSTVQFYKELANAPH